MESTLDENPSIKQATWGDELNGPPHECFWCGKMTTVPFWSCPECYPKKEAAYKHCREQGINTWIEIIIEATKECNK